MIERTVGKHKGYMSEDKNNILFQTIINDPCGKITYRDFASLIGVSISCVIINVGKYRLEHPEMDSFFRERAKRSIQEHGRIGGKIAVEDGLGMFRIDHVTGQPYAVAGAALGRQTVIERKTGVVNQTGEQKKKYGRLGGFAARDRRAGFHGMTKEAKVALGRKSFEEGTGIFGYEYLSKQALRKSANFVNPETKSAILKMGKYEVREILADEARSKVIIARYFEGKTLKQIGQGRGITREAVRQLEKRSLEQLGFRKKAVVAEPQTAFPEPPVEQHPLPEKVSPP